MDLKVSLAFQQEVINNIIPPGGTGHYPLQ